MIAISSHPQIQAGADAQCQVKRNELVLGKGHSETHIWEAILRPEYASKLWHNYLPHVYPQSLQNNQ